MTLPVAKTASARSQGPFRSLRPWDATTSVIEHDLACMGCGYNLKSLQTVARCPECDVPVGRSRAEDMVWSVSGTWLRVQATGLLIIVAAAALAVVIFVQPNLIPGEIGLLAVWGIGLLVLAWPEQRRFGWNARLRAIVAIGSLDVAMTSAALMMKDQHAERAWVLMGAISAIAALFHGASLTRRLPEPIKAWLMHVLAVIVAVMAMPPMVLVLLAPPFHRDVLMIALFLAIVGLGFLYIGVLLLLMTAIELLYLAHVAPRRVAAARCDSSENAHAG